ncbi:LysR family transcriptional regulator [Stella humosa]|uniref:LysR family transcriptional regulator n=1 Tax=Stella humosa TaxID=94 RepID=A0A3N1MG75_9PROT|nr:LysR family transcriptional regulator [Stella humosa]ROQ01757.1 LysR family transcriptional regulator [Stella humosa]BBK32140.1 transcriptional regulator [Stella humosa]
MTIELRHFRQFAVLGEELHFGRAAARLGMAQPPLSQSIRRIEDHLGFPLLVRSRRHVELTPAGRVFLGEARRTLAQADDAILLGRRAAAEEMAGLNIGFVVSALFGLLPAAIRAFRLRFPQVGVRLDQRSTNEQTAGLVQGDVDAGFLHPPIHDAAGITVRTIRQDPMVAAVPETHALALRTELRLADLAGEPMILFPHVQGPNLHGRLTHACRMAGFVPRIVQEARQMQVILTLVAAGMGVSMVPSGTRAMNIDGVRLLPIADMPRDLTWDMAIAWRPKGAGRPLRSFIETVLELAPEYATDTDFCPSARTSRIAEAEPAESA